MKYELKGNYFNNEFNMPPTSGPDAVEHYLKRECPSDTTINLWDCPIEYRHVDPIISSAKKGYQTWRKTTIEERIEVLKRYQEAVIARQEEIAEAIAWEVGKPLWEARTEAAALVAKVNVTISDSLPRIAAKKFENILPNTDGHIIYKPIGPSFVIGPFNFPCHLANGQILSALIAGNSIIFKPSGRTAYSCQIMIECFHAAGFPDGVINMIQGDGEIGRRILKSKDIKGVFFTGSKEVGKKILKQTHEDLSKLVSLELGGKNAAIVHKDANFDHTLTELIKGAFLTTGQRCTSTALVIIHEDLKDKFISAFHEVAKKIIVAHPVDSDVEPFMGPLIDKQSVDSYLLFMGMAKREGIIEIMRGKSLEKKTPGHYVSPSIHLAEKWDDDSHFLASEIFGPNVTFIPYKDIDDAIEIANKSEYGLAASVFTADKEIYNLCLRDLETGLVNLNRSTVGASSKLPFGGVKNSGNYRPAAVTTIDACVYQLASLEIDSTHTDDLSSIKGLEK
jgi:succinylglutamic semialdehyde dehydrogenase